MKATLIFPSYLLLSGFMALAENGDIELDLRRKSLTAFFNEKDVEKAVTMFKAKVIYSTA